MGKTKGKKRQEEQKRDFNWKLLPLQFILVVLPLVLYLYMGNSGYSAYSWNSSEDSYVDVFLHGKMIVFMVVAAVTLVLAVHKTVNMNREDRKQALCRFIPLFVYFGFVVLSTICSENISHSLFGSMDAKEPFGVLAGYVIVAFYAYIAVDELADLATLTAAAVIGGVGMAVVGVLQVVGKDPLTTEFVQRIFAGTKEICKSIFII